jgi:hypothetical protein
MCAVVGDTRDNDLCLTAISSRGVDMTMSSSTQLIEDNDSKVALIQRTDTDYQVHVVPTNPLRLQVLLTSRSHLAIPTVFRALLSCTPLSLAASIRLRAEAATSPPVPPFQYSKSLIPQRFLYYPLSNLIPIASRLFYTPSLTELWQYCDLQECIALAQPHRSQRTHAHPLSTTRRLRNDLARLRTTLTRRPTNLPALRQ